MLEHAVRLWETRDLQRQEDARSPKQSLGGQGICLITRPNLPVGTIPPEGEREDCSTAFAVAGWRAGRDIPSEMLLVAGEAWDLLRQQVQVGMTVGNLLLVLPSDFRGLGSLTLEGV